jgi:hypothetical protein
MSERRRRSVKPGEPWLGRRDTDAQLTTRDVANRLGVTPGFVVAEINQGRLRALVIRREGRRSLYRVSPADLGVYVKRYGWVSAAAVDDKRTTERR